MAEVDRIAPGSGRRRRRALLVTGCMALLSLVGLSRAIHTQPTTSDPSASISPVADKPKSIPQRSDEKLSFNRDVRPILSDKCFACHGFDAKKREAGLRLDLREEAIMPRENGTAIVPGDPDASTLIKRVETSSAKLIMPPPRLHKKVTAEERDILRRWIAQGAEYQPHWAFIVPSEPELPAVVDSAWVRNDIDRFVLAKLEAQDIKPSPEAGRRTLIRRLYLDLIGLPPTPEEVDSFINDTAPDAYEKIVEKLLASEHFGERWAMPWLDAARYADSNSYQFDNDRWAWPWRDWLIRAINSNRRFDEVIVEMLAGDLLPEPTQEQLIATSFNRNHFINGEGGAIAEEVRFNYALDRVETTATTFLGLTYACAQCHDHKYDPISQKNFYEFFALFAQTDETGTRHKSVPTWDFQYVIDKPFISIATDAQEQELKRLEAVEAEAFNAFGGKQAKNKLVNAARNWANALTPQQVSELSGLIYGLVGRARYERNFQAPMQDAKFLDYYARHVAPQDTPGIDQYKAWNDAQRARMKHQQTMPLVMVMGDRKTPIEVRVRNRGLYSAPVGDPVTPGIPVALGELAKDQPSNRLGFARWMVSDRNPLTARVLVNRLWQEVFGVGIVKTPEDFGLQGALPTHPELLDYLAVKYRKHWDTKEILRQIVTSATYRQSSTMTPDLLQLDPENKLLARGPRFRLPAMLIRDQALVASGLFNNEMFGAPVYPYQPPGLWIDVSFAQFEYVQSESADLYRRSIYSFFRRTLAPPNLFDNANRQACTVKISRTNTPLQALTLLNDPTYVEAARALAMRSMQRRPGADPRDLIREMVLLTLLRPVEDRELEVLVAAYEREHKWYAQHTQEAAAYLAVGELRAPEGIEPTHLAALSSVAQTIMNLDEAMTKE